MLYKECGRGRERRRLRVEEREGERDAVLLCL